MAFASGFSVVDRRDWTVLASLAWLTTGIYCAAVLIIQGALTWGGLIETYRGLTAWMSAGSFGAYVLWCVLRAAIAPNPSPARTFAKSMARALPWLVMLLLLAPIFFASFTALKTLIGTRLGFSWDGHLANLEAAILGADAWRHSHAAFGGKAATLFLQWSYHPLWFGLLGISISAVPLFAAREFAARFLLAMMLTWVICGLLAASVVASAGPCFAHLFDAGLGARFQPLMDRLAVLLDDSSSILQSQAYLAETWDGSIVPPFGGISAFPSVHVAVAGLYVAASWRSRVLRVASIAFALAIWIGSVHFGYHYAIDGPVGVAIAIACWKLAGRIIAAMSTPEARSAPASSA